MKCLPKNNVGVFSFCAGGVKNACSRLASSLCHVRSSSDTPEKDGSFNKAEVFSVDSGSGPISCATMEELTKSQDSQGVVSLRFAFSPFGESPDHPGLMEIVHVDGSKLYRFSSYVRVVTARVEL